MNNIKTSLVESNVGTSRISKIRINSLLFSYPCDSSFVCAPYKVELPKGTYKIECYGAGSYTGGGYTSGILSINDPLTLYFYLGASESHLKEPPPTGITFNGGSGNQLKYSSTGNGATDVRLDYSTNWFDFPSLKSRIMVAGGAGGSEVEDRSINEPPIECSIGGFGGGIQAGDGVICDFKDIDGSTYTSIGYGGSNTEGGAGRFKGEFGRATSSDGDVLNRNAGGGGYYGGGSSSDGGASGGGGSSFISGYFGCDAISENSVENNIIHTGQSIHYSQIVFTDPIMKAGNETFVSPNRHETETGHHSSGNIVLTLLYPFNICAKTVLQFSSISNCFSILIYVKMK